MPYTVSINDERNLVLVAENMDIIWHLRCISSFQQDRRLQQPYKHQYDAQPNDTWRYERTDANYGRHV